MYGFFTQILITIMVIKKSYVFFHLKIYFYIKNIINTLKRLYKKKRTKNKEIYRMKKTIKTVKNNNKSWKKKWKKKINFRKTIFKENIFLK